MRPSGADLESEAHVVDVEDSIGELGEHLRSDDATRDGRNQGLRVSERGAVARALPKTLASVGDYSRGLRFPKPLVAGSIPAGSAARRAHRAIRAA